MQNSVNFPWPVNTANAFPPNTPNGDPSKAQWQEYQNFAADFLFKNHQKNQPNIYNQSAISQLAAHSHNYLESLSSPGHQPHNQPPHPLPEPNELNGFNDLNEKCPHYENRTRASCELCVQHYPLNFNKGEPSVISFVSIGLNELTRFFCLPRI